MFRDAQPPDRKEFLDLWTRYLQELEGFGGEYTPDRETMRAVRDLFDAYVYGDLPGVCVLYQPPGSAVLGAAFCGAAWGSKTIPGTKFGKVGWGWGVYLSPEERKQEISGPLQANTRRKLEKLGFDTLVGDILLANEASMAATKAAGWVPHSVIHVMRLGE